MESLDENTEPELTQFSEKIPNLSPDARELLNDLKDWLALFKPLEIIEKEDKEGVERVKAMDPEFVATMHSTCESDQITVGFHEFRPGNCCWHEYAFMVLKNKAVEDDYVNTSIYTNCMACNPGGDDEVEDADCDACFSDGWDNIYFDEYVDFVEYWKTLEKEGSNE